MENDLQNNYVKQSHRKFSKTGLILVVIGAALLAANLGGVTAAWKSVIFSWPMLLIFIGAVHIPRKHFFSSALLMLLGAYFLENRIYPLLSPVLAQVYWPVILISAGLLFMLHYLIPASHKHTHHYYRQKCRKQYDSYTTVE